MKKLLRPKDLLLLGIAGSLDIFEEVSDPLGIMATACKNIYGWVPPRYRRRHFYNLVWRSLRTGEIEKIIKDEKPYLRLTSAGARKIKRDFPLLTKKEKRWDRRWRIVFYDISEISRRKRDFLRAKLKELGFGMIQRSVWITPFDFAKDFREFVESRGLGECVYILESPALLAGDPKKLAAKIWPLESLNKSYKKIFNELTRLIHTLVKTYDRKKKLKANSRLSREIKGIKTWYLETLLVDPLLPKELLPQDYLREKLEKALRKLIKLEKGLFS